MQCTCMRKGQTSWRTIDITVLFTRKGRSIGIQNNNHIVGTMLRRRIEVSKKDREAQKDRSKGLQEEREGQEEI